jgi:hypothetical protein
MVAHHSKASVFRERALEIRARAEVVSDKNVREILLRIAADYEYYAIRPKLTLVPKEAR